jgi:hypothetical protein
MPHIAGRGGGGPKDAYKRQSAANPLKEGPKSAIGASMGAFYLSSRDAPAYIEKYKYNVIIINMRTHAEITTQVEDALGESVTEALRTLQNQGITQNYNAILWQSANDAIEGLASYDRSGALRIALGRAAIQKKIDVLLGRQQSMQSDPQSLLSREKNPGRKPPHRSLAEGQDSPEPKTE